jgi:hypothetical protein
LNLPKNRGQKSYRWLDEKSANLMHLEECITTNFLRWAHVNENQNFVNCWYPRISKLRSSHENSLLWNWC